MVLSQNPDSIYDVYVFFKVLWDPIFFSSGNRASKDVDAGKVAPSFKSQPEPTGTEDVKVVVANTVKKETIGVQNLEETLGSLSPLAMGQLGQPYEHN